MTIGIGTSSSPSGRWQAGGRIEWGHAVSTDFVHWTELPTALGPGDAGDYDSRGCYSGCCARRDDGRVVAVYSGHTGTGELPCLAVADDAGLVHWTKSPRNPVIHARPPIEGITDFRDHSLTRRGDVWEQWVAVGGDQGGMIVGYTSTDLEHWSYAGVLLSAREADLPDGTWECPDVFEIGGTTVVIVSWYSAIDRGVIEVFADDGRAVTVCDLALVGVSRIDVRRLGDGSRPVEVGISALRIG